MKMTVNPYDPPSEPSTLQPATVERGVVGNRRDYAAEYNGAFVRGLIVQGTLGALTALVHDGGQMHRAFWVAILAQWAAVWMVLLRRPLNPTAADLWFARYGVLPIFAVIVLVATLTTWR